MPSLNECVKIVMKAAGEGVLSEDQAQDVVKQIEDFVKAKKSLTGDLDIEVLKHIKALGNNALLAAAIEKRNALMNVASRAKMLRYVSRFKDDPALGVKAYLGGTVRVFEGGRLSVDALGRSLFLKYTGRMVDEMEKAGVFEFFTRGILDREIAQELWEIRPNGNQGVSGSVEARTIAEIIHKWQSIAVDRQNRAGAYILKRPGYIVRQSHDMHKIRRAGFDAWRDFIIDKLDHELTFGLADPDEFLRSAYEGLQTGMHLRAKGDGESTHLTGFKGPSNVAKKVSAERMLHFRSADAWSEYNQKFGTSNLREAVVYGLEHAARNTALMEGLGTNPGANLDYVLRQLKRAHRDTPKVFDELSSNSIMNLYKEIEGTSRIPANISAARVNASIRILQNMAKLGGAVISSVTDIPFQVAELRYQGHSVFESYGRALGNIFVGRGSAEKREIGRLLGAGFDGIIGDIMARFSSQDSVPAMLSKTQQRFFKLNLLTWWNDTHRAGVTRMMATKLADDEGKTFEELAPELQRLFSMYEIGKTEWDLIRDVGLLKVGDYRIISPSELQKIPTTTINKFYGTKSEKAAQRVRDRLENALQAYYVDRADFAIPIPGAAERAFMNQGTQPGTGLGEALRYIMQFKSFPITAIHKQIGREIYGHGANTLGEAFLQGKGDILGLAHLIAASTLFGYLAMSIKDLARGREPRKMTSERVVLAAMAQGGGLGIYGDFLFGEFQKYGRSALGTLAGPVFGQFDSLGAMWSSAIRGEDFGAEALRFAINNTPFMNLFYTRSALDYMILYQLQEMSNPGYLRRMEGRMLRDYDQKFFIPPSSVIPYGGGDEPFEALQ